MDQINSFTIKNVEHKYYIKGEVSDVKSENIELLGFKSSYPVLKCKKLMENITTRHSNTNININDVKYIYLNGKKVKVVPFAVTQNSQKDNKWQAQSNIIKSSKNQIKSSLPILPAKFKLIPYNNATKRQVTENINNVDKLIKASSLIIIPPYKCLKDIVKPLTKTNDCEQRFIYPPNKIIDKLVVESKSFEISETPSREKNLISISDYNINIGSINNDAVENSLFKNTLNTTVKINNARGVPKKNSTNAETSIDDLIKTSSKCTQINTTTLSKATQTTPAIINDKYCINSGLIDEKSDPFLAPTFSIFKYLDNNSTYESSMLFDSGKSEDNKIKIQFFEDLRNCLTSNSEGNLPIHEAIVEKNFQRVKRNCVVLKIRKVEIDVPNHENLTPLQFAIIHNSSEDIIKLLLSYGADENITTSDGNSLLHLAVENNNIIGLQILLNTSYNFKIDCFNYEGVTPLMLSCINNCYRAATLLLDNNASPNVRDLKSGRTSLFHAVQTSDVNLIKLVLNHGADTKIKNFYGTSPHDMMFEIEDVPNEIRNLILTKSGSYTVKRIENRKFSLKKRSINEPGNTNKKLKYEKSDSL